MSVVLYSVQDGVARLTMNRPAVLNASNGTMKWALLDAIKQAEKDDAVGALVLTGAGRAFCVGGDLKESPAHSADEYRDRIRLQQTLCQALWNAHKPLVAAVNGYAIGGGLEMALMCDIRIAARSARLGTPVTRIGSTGTGGLHDQLARVVGRGWAVHLVLSADYVDAEAALRIGLVTAVHDDDALVAEAHQLASRIAGYPRANVGAAKIALRQASGGGLPAAWRLEEDLAVANFEAP